MELTAVLFVVTLILYTGAAILYLWSVLGENMRVVRVASRLATLGLLTHGAVIADICIRMQRAVLANLSESLLFLAWALMTIYLVTARRYRITALGIFATLISLSMVAVAASLPQGVSSTLMPALRSHWRVIHVTPCLVGYAAFILAFGAAICYVIQERLLKTKRITTIQQHLPSLDVADHLAYTMVSFGFPMLTLGIITGALWAQTAWGRYWGWDSKETWSLITWLIYAAYLHVRIVSRWRGKWANRLLIIGFICVLVTFFGVNFLSNGLHQYNW